MGKFGDETRARDRSRLIGEHLNLLAKVEYEPVSEIAEHIAKAYRDEQIDSVYLIFNEFKSVISQRLIAQRILPVQELGSPRSGAGRGIHAGRARAHGRGGAQRRHQP